MGYQTSAWDTKRGTEFLDRLPMLLKSTNKELASFNECSISTENLLASLIEAVKENTARMDKIISLLEERNYNNE